VSIVLCSFLTLALFVSVPRAHGLDSTRSPGTVTSFQVDPIDCWWHSTNYVKVSDDQRAFAIFYGSTTTTKTHRLKATNFGFNLPSTAIITGIVVEVERSRDGWPMTDSEIFLIKSDGSLGSNNKADTSTEWPDLSNEAYRTYGGSSDLWGESWTASDINDQDFGVSVRAQIVPPHAEALAWIDHVCITVFYNAPTATLSVEKQAIEISVCSNFEIEIWVLDIDPYSMANLFFELSWDPDLMRYTGHVEEYGGAFNIDTSQASNGKLIVTWEPSLSPYITADTKLLTASYHCEGLGSSSIDFTQSGWIEEDGREFNFASLQDGTCNQISVPISPPTYIVGGFYSDANQLEVISPYLTLVILLGVVTTTLIVRKRRKE
jgi:hypothetical protein